MGISELKESYRSKKVRVFTMEEYLEGCKSTPAFYHNAHERMLSAIGEPELVDTTKDPRLMNIFTGRTIKRYASFKDFFGMEEASEQIVAYFRHGAQGAEERKQVLYLLGPVGGGKSSVAERLKMLIEQRDAEAKAEDDRLQRLAEDISAGIAAMSDEEKAAMLKVLDEALGRDSGE